MHTVPCTKLLLASTIAMSLAACGSDDHNTPANPPVAQPVLEAGDTVMLTASGRIVSLNAGNTVRTKVALSGLQASETLLGIDFRPLDGLLYGLGSTGRIYTINPGTGAASLRSTLVADAADTSAPFTALAGSDYAVDFNPAADRLRVVSDSGQNLRINVDTGATTTDGAVNRAGAMPVVAAGAYSNSFAGTTATMLFVLDSASDNLALVNPPNDGTLTNIGAAGVDVAGRGSMDIAGGANGLVLAAVRSTASGPTSLYRVDLATGAAVPFNGAAAPANSVIGAGGVGVLDIAVVLK